MKIVYLAAGAGGMYCGSCLHDNTLAAALNALGEEVVLMPTYTPIRTDEQDVSEPRVMYGGISVYLQQKLGFFRRTPWALDRLWDRPRLIGALARMSMSTDPAALGDITVSMLKGEEGNQRKELDKLLHWLAADARPDVVHLSNVMLLGMAREIRRRLRVPVVCTLSGEDIFLEKLSPPWYAQARQALVERARDVDAFVALNRYFAEFMTDYAQLDRDKVHVIPHGLKLAGHGSRQRNTEQREVTIGYLARICEDKGLHHLADALALLSADPALPRVVVRTAGYLGKADRPYFERVAARFRDAGLADRFSYVGEPDRAGKIAFLQSLDVFCLPTEYRESKGLPVLEAWANAVPAVLPAHGAFPEMVEDTGGGLLHEPANPRAIADALRTLILDPARAEAHGLDAQRAIRERYNDTLMAHRTRDLYRRLLEQPVPAKVSQA